MGFIYNETEAVAYLKVQCPNIADDIQKWHDATEAQRVAARENATTIFETLPTDVKNWFKLVRKLQ